MTTDVEVKPRKMQTQPGDHDKFAHYLDKTNLTESLVLGYTSKALCGKVWVPTRGPDGFSVCPECQEIYDNLV